MMMNVDFPVSILLSIESTLVFIFKQAKILFGKEMIDSIKLNCLRHAEVLVPKEIILVLMCSIPHLPIADGQRRVRKITCHRSMIN